MNLRSIDSGLGGEEKSKLFKRLYHQTCESACFPTIPNKACKIINQWIVKINFYQSPTNNCKDNGTWALMSHALAALLQYHYPLHYKNRTTTFKLTLMVRKFIRIESKVINNLPYLGQRQCGNEIDEEIRFYVPPCNHARVPHKLTPSKDPRTGSYISCSEFDNQVQKVKEIRNGPPEGDNNLQMQVGFYTRSLPIPSYPRQIEVERVDE